MRPLSMMQDPRFSQLVEADLCGFFEPVLNVAYDLSQQGSAAEADRLLDWGVETGGLALIDAAAACAKARAMPSFAAKARAFGGEQVFRRRPFSNLTSHIVSGSRYDVKRWSWLSKAYFRDVEACARAVVQDADADVRALKVLHLAGAHVTLEGLDAQVTLLTTRMEMKGLSSESIGHLASRLEGRLEVLRIMIVRREAMAEERNKLKEQWKAISGKTTPGALRSSNRLSAQIRDLNERLAEIKWSIAHRETARRWEDLRSEFCRDLLGQPMCPGGLLALLKDRVRNAMKSESPPWP